MKKWGFSLLFSLLFLPAMAIPALQKNRMNDDTTVGYLSISKSFLYEVRTGENTKYYTDLLAKADLNSLELELNTDNRRNTFWLNIYNAFTQMLLSGDKSLYKSRVKFFTTKWFTVAGQRLSLDDIEHGILRCSKIKWSLGHFNKLFAGEFEKRFRVKKLDYRIHFALNCGAKSCPPIAFYDDAKIDQQLQLATKTYLSNEVNFDKTKNIVELPAIISWFRRDFGGKKKVILLLENLGIIPENNNPKIKFKKYDWELYLSNYAGDNE